MKRVKFAYFLMLGTVIILLGGFIFGAILRNSSQRQTINDLNSQLSSAYARIETLTNAQGNVYQWQVAVNELRNKIDDLTIHLEMADKGITKSGTYASEYTR